MALALHRVGIGGVRERGKARPRMRSCYFPSHSLVTATGEKLQQGLSENMGSWVPEEELLSGSSAFYWYTGSIDP